MITRIFTPILIALSVLAGTHFNTVDAPNPETPLRNEQIAADLAKNLKASLAESIPWIVKPKTANLPEIPPQKLPEAENIPFPDLKIRAGLSASQEGRIFYQKDAENQFPVASLTKLITALVVLDNIPAGQIVTVNKKAVDTHGEMGNLVVNEEISVENLLYIMLVDSSNDAAVALAEAALQCRPEGSPAGGIEGPRAATANYKTCDLAAFAALMNKKAREIGLINSRFIDPAGLDSGNVSTASDLFLLSRESLRRQLIKKIINTKEIDVFSSDGKIAHHLMSTNKLFGKINGVAGGKTGYTEEAGECMILVVDSPQNNSYFISIVLGTEIGMRFIEMEKLVRWTKYTYGW